MYYTLCCCPQQLPRAVNTINTQLPNHGWDQVLCPDKSWKCQYTWTVSMFLPRKYSCTIQFGNEGVTVSLGTEVLIRAATCVGWGQICTLQEAQYTQHVRARQRRKMAGHLQIDSQVPSLHGMQRVVPEWWMVDTGVQLEHQGGFTLGMINRVERLCLLCPECRRPTTAIRA